MLFMDYIVDDASIENGDFLWRRVLVDAKYSEIARKDDGDFMILKGAFRYRDDGVSSHSKIMMQNLSMDEYDAAYHPKHESAVIELAVDKLRDLEFLRIRHDPVDPKEDSYKRRCECHVLFGTTLAPPDRDRWADVFVALKSIGRIIAIPAG